MNRRRFACAACGAAALAVVGAARAQPAWKAPARFMRPETATDEGGLWALMDREEARLRQSPFLMRDEKLNAYVRGIVCRLAVDHCPDVRVRLVHTPLFNASMAPNGMMQVWSGLLLRVENEAQLAAVLGHEIGHYLERHIVERLRDLRSRTAFAQFLGMFGLAGALGQLALLASAFGFSRDQERDADRIGVTLMRDAGYDLAEAAKVWENLLLELKARPDGLQRSPMFATHPSPEERKEMLSKMAAATPGGATGEREWNEVIQPFRMDLLKDEIQRGQHEESIALLTRMIARTPALPELPFARAEVHRIRAIGEDYDLAIRDYQLAMSVGAEPAEVHRGMGLIYRARKQMPEARESLASYLERAPAAPDAPLIRSYLKEMER